MATPIFPWQLRCFWTCLIMGARFVLFELLLALCCCRYVEPSMFTRLFSQSTVELLPCKELTSTVSLYNSTLITIMANLSHCQNSYEMNATVSQPLAIKFLKTFSKKQFCLLIHIVWCRVSGFQQTSLLPRVTPPSQWYSQPGSWKMMDLCLGMHLWSTNVFYSLFET